MSDFRQKAMNLADGFAAQTKEALVNPPAPPAPTKVAIPCPYRCQYDNHLYAAGSCNMTSLGMAMEKYGITVPGPYSHNPDNLLRYCDEQGLDRHSLEVIAKVSRHFGLSDNAGYAVTFAEIKAHLLGGNLVIVQGQFTPSGHIIVVCGFDSVAGTWLCNDPAGDHNQPNGYRDPGWKSGEQVWYPADWFRRSAAPDGNGLVWAHLLR